MKIILKNFVSSHECNVFLSSLLTDGWLFHLFLAFLFLSDTSSLRPSSTCSMIARGQKNQIGGNALENHLFTLDKLAKFLFTERFVRQNSYICILFLFVFWPLFVLLIIAIVFRFTILNEDKIPHYVYLLHHIFWFIVSE